MTAVALTSYLCILSLFQGVPLVSEDFPRPRMKAVDVGVPVVAPSPPDIGDTVDYNAWTRRAAPIAMGCVAAGFFSSSALTFCFLLISESGGGFDGAVYTQPRKFAIAFTSANVLCTGLGTWGLARVEGQKGGWWKTPLGAAIGSALGAGLMYVSAAHDCLHPNPDCLLFGPSVLVGGLCLPILGTLVGLNL